MFDLSALFQRAGKAAADNSPAILTAIGVTGTITTAYLAAKGAFRSVDALKEAEDEKREHFFGDQTDVEGKIVEVEFDGLTFQEKFDATWKYYTPAAISGGMTIAAIICSNRISDKRAAAMASAYSIAEKGFKEYREKTLEKVGKKKEQEVRDEIAQDDVTNNPVSKSTLIVATKGPTVCKDKWSGRYFNSDIESIRKAVNDFNQERINSSYLPLSEFYHLIGIPPTQESEEVGWNADKPLEVKFSGTLHPDGTPAVVFEFENLPDPNYARFH